MYINTQMIICSTIFEFLTNSITQKKKMCTLGQIENTNI